MPAPKPPGPLTLLARSRKARWWAVGLLVGLPVMYVLSVPPALWHFPPTAWWVVMPYAEPYIWLMDALPPPLNKPLLAYYWWWVVPSE